MILKFNELIDKYPNNYKIISIYVKACKRIDQLDLIDALLDDNYTAPGAYFCKGLLDKSRNNIEEALANFLISVKNKEWKNESIFEIIEIIMNLDRPELFWEPGLGSTERQDIYERSHGLLNYVIIFNLI